MEELGTYISLFRKFEKWEWYKDVPVKTVFIHCLIKANYKPLKYKGKIIERGSFVTSRKNFAFDVGLTEQQVRGAWDKLILTNEITKTTTNRETVIKVMNFDKYQIKPNPNNQQYNQEYNQQRTNKQPSKNQQITTSNKDNNKNKEKKPLLLDRTFDEIMFPDVAKELEEKELEYNQFYGTTIIELFESEFARQISQLEYMRLIDWLSKYEDKLIRYALREALVYEKKSLDYIECILINWKKRNFNCKDYEEGKR